MLGESAAWMRPLSAPQWEYFERNRRYMAATIARMRWVSRKLRPEEIDDAAFDGLLKAAATFDPGRMQESSYAVMCIRFALREAADRAKPPFVSLDHVLTHAEADYSGEDARHPLRLAERLIAPGTVEESARVAAIYHAIEEMPPRQAQALLLRLSGQTWEEIGRALRVNGSRALRIHRRALSDLRARLAVWAS